MRSYHADLRAGFGEEGPDGASGGTFHGEARTASDKELEHHYNPPLDQEIREIEREVDAMRHAGTLRPFVEGEAIGAFPRRVRSLRLSKEELNTLHNERMQRRQTAMLAHREQNDRVLDSLLGRVF